MRVRRGAALIAVIATVLTILIGGADATAEPASDRACADASSLAATALPGTSAMQVSFRVVRCAS